MFHNSAAVPLLTTTNGIIILQWNASSHEVFDQEF